MRRIYLLLFFGIKNVVCRKSRAHFYWVLKLIGVTAAIYNLLILEFHVKISEYICIPVAAGFLSVILCRTPNCL